MSNRSLRKDERLFEPSEIVLLTILGLLLVLNILTAIMSQVAVNSHIGNLFSANMIKSFVYSIITALCLYLVGTLIKNQKINLKDWLAISFYAVVFLLVNVYNLFGLFNYLILNIFAELLIGVSFAIIGVSVYYNYLKNENNRVKAKAIVVCIFALTFSIAGGFLIELLKYFASLIFENTFYSFGKVALNVLYATVGSLIIDIIFFFSLKGSKKLINACLIDIEMGEYED